MYRMTAAAQVPKFNAPVYLENKTQVGKVEEVLGPLSEVYFAVKPVEGVLATSFKAGEKIFMAPDKLMPLQRFTQTADASKTIRKPGAGGRGGTRRRGSSVLASSRGSAPRSRACRRVR